MKRIRRIASFLLAMAMVFGLTATALAATVNNETDHSYDAYQIFKGTQEAEENSPALGDVKWGEGVNGPELLAALQGEQRFNVGEGKANIFAGCEDAADVAAVLDEYQKTEGVAEAFANLADLNRRPVVTKSIGANDTSVELPPGYYLLVDTTEFDPDAIDASNSALLQVTNNGEITIRKKYDLPKVDKSVTGTDGETGEATDCNIGDIVTFTLTGTLPEKGLEDYETYKYQFNDELSKGLQYKDDAKVYLYKDGNVENGATDNKIEVTDKFSIKLDTAENKLTISIDDLKEPVLEANNATSQSKIVVEYTAELTAEAETGAGGNANKVTLTYSNNPNKGGEGSTATSREDEVLVFTYKLVGTKIGKKEDGATQEKPLAGAKFILYRGIDGKEPGEDGADGNPTGVEYALIQDGKLAGWTTDRAEAEAETNLLKSEETTGEFKLAGLDDGIYYLEETKAPEGYNSLKAPIKIVIKAVLDTAEDTPGLTDLTIKVDEKDAEKGDIITGMVSLKVENSAGVLLPSTGGMGTTLFYVVGAALVLAAGALLVMKRRTGEGK